MKHRSSIPAVVLLTVGTLAASSSAQVMPGPVAPARPTEKAVAEKLRLDAVTLVTVDADTTPGIAQRVQVAIEGRPVTLDLQPYSVRAPGFRLQEQLADGSLREVDPGPINTLRGVVVGEAGSIVAGGVMPDGLYCTVVFADGRQYWLEPIAARVPGAAKTDYALYRNGDGFARGLCGTTEDQRQLGDAGGPQNPGEPGGGGLRGATRWTADLATDADYEFYLSYGGTTNVNSRIGIVTNTMNLQYERDADIAHSISVTRVRTAEPDPYSTTDPATLNAQITSAWTGDPFTKDVIILYTAKEIDGSVIGRANAIGSICNSQSSNCFVQSDFDGNFSSATDLSAHELGHLWNGSHCTCSSPASTMNPFITSINRFGVNANDTAISTIPAYRNTRGCLTTSSPGVAPANDACANAVRIAAGTFAFGTANATTDGPAVASCDGATNANNDIWYIYIAPCDGTLTLQTCVSSPDTSFDTVLAAYTGFCGSLTQVACDDDTTCGSGIRQSFISFPVAAGVSYIVRLGSYDPAVTGSGILTVSQAACPAPANDLCANAITIQHNTNYSFSTFGARTDGPVEAACSAFSDDTVGSDIWFRIMAPCTGTMRVSLCGSSYDTRLGIYGASCPAASGSIIACNDDNGPACSGTRSSIDFAATAFSTYLLRVGGYNNIQGVGTLRVDALGCPPPANDFCASAIPVGVGSTAFTNIGASTDGPAEPASCNFFNEPQMGSDVWFRMNTSCFSRYRFSLCNANYDTEIGLYSSCPSGPGTVIACDDDNGPACAGTRSSLDTPTPMSGPLYIRIGGYGGASGAATGSGTLVITRIAVVDCDGNGLIQPVDVACFVNLWFSSLQGGTLAGDFDLNGTVAPADVASFVSAWFAALNSGC